MQRGGRGSGIAVDPDRIREARLEAGLSLAQLAQDDVSRTFIHLIENGKSRPSRRVLALIARRTGKPMSYFAAEPGRAIEVGLSLPSELTRTAGHIREFVGSQSLDEVEYSSMKLIEATLKQAAQVTRAIQRRDGEAKRIR